MKRFAKAFATFVVALLLTFTASGVTGSHVVRADDLSGSQSAKELTLDTWAYDDVTDTQQSFWYKVTIPSDGYLKLAANTNTGGWLNLYNADASKSYVTEYDLPDDGTSKQWTVCLDAGTYLIRFTHFGKTGKIGAKVSLEPGNNNEGHDNISFDTARNLNSGELINGFLSEDKQNDYYKFSVAANGKVTINATSECTSDVVLYNSDRKDITEGKLGIEGYDNRVSGEKGNVATKEFTPELTAGIYYLKVGSIWDNDRGRYTLKVTTDTPAAPTTPAAQPAAAPQEEAVVTMYRAYNPNSGEHFYTGNTKEFNYLVSIGWRNEGTGWVAPQSSSTPVYRLYNKNGGEHHYTMSAKEKNALVAAGWKDEGIGWYSDDQQRTPLYRQYNPNAFANNHNYTTSEKEKNYLVSIGWKDEGLAWYGVRAQ